MKSKTPDKTSNSFDALPKFASIEAKDKSTSPKAKNSVTTPSKKPKSPTLFTINALLAASTFSLFP